MAYPATIDTIPTYAGTSLQGDIDHAGVLHGTANTIILSLENTLGTTGGTSVLKNFAAGDFSARINATNVLQQAISGTINNSILGTPSIIGGTITSPKINEDVALTATATQLNAVGSGGVTTRLQSKIISSTRDTSALGGDVSYTGVGFMPTSIIAMANIDNALVFSIGFADSSKLNYTTGNINGPVWYRDLDGVVELGSSGGYQVGKVKTFDADGFTLTWTKNATPPSGTGKLTFICFK